MSDDLLFKKLTQLIEEARKEELADELWKDDKFFMDVLQKMVDNNEIGPEEASKIDLKKIKALFLEKKIIKPFTDGLIAEINRREKEINDRSQYQKN